LLISYVAFIFDICYSKLLTYFLKHVNGPHTDYFAPSQEVHEYCNLHVCMSVCSHVQISLNFLYMLPVAQSSSDDNAIHHIRLVLWTTSCFHIMGQIQIQASGELFKLLDI